MRSAVSCALPARFVVRPSPVPPVAGARWSGVPECLPEFPVLRPPVCQESVHALTSKCRFFVASCFVFPVRLARLHLLFDLPVVCACRSSLPPASPALARPLGVSPDSSPPTLFLRFSLFPSRLLRPPFLYKTFSRCTHRFLFGPGAGPCRQTCLPSGNPSHSCCPAFLWCPGVGRGELAVSWCRGGWAATPRRPRPPCWPPCWRVWSTSGLVSGLALVWCGDGLLGSSGSAAGGALDERQWGRAVADHIGPR